MVRLALKSVLLSLVVVAVLLSTMDRANAWWWGCCQPAYSCYSPCVSACDPCGYGGGLYLGWRPGPVRRLLLGPCRWYYAGYWCGGCCTATYTPCCSSLLSCCTPNTSTPATQAQPTPAQKPVIEPPANPTPAMPPNPGQPENPATTPSPAVPSEPTSTQAPTPETSGVVTVWVPYDAKVTINGLATTSTGSRRQFVSFGLKPGFSYKYEIKASVLRDGKMLEDTRMVNLTAGQNTAIAFGFTTNPAQDLASTN
jgi:uncharacterized protein (TIGR03000 family)